MGTAAEERFHSYLESHLAGALEAVALLKDAAERWEGEPAAAFFEALRGEIEEDKGALERVVDRVGAAPSLLKSAGALASEKAFALRQRLVDGRLGLLETLEALLLGVRGKQALWDALAAIAPGDGRLGSFDFAALARRAEDQLGRIETHRRAAARAALGGAPPA